MTKYAHFENVPLSKLQDLYERHAEVARDIHQDVLRQFTGNQNLTVDLVRLSPLSPLDSNVIDKMSEYDVVSVSTEIGLKGMRKGTGIADAAAVNLYKKQFSGGDMPIYVTLAGNSGESLQRAQPRVADFFRTSLVVGESNRDEQSVYIEEHSSKVNPTLLSDNPFNRGVKYQYYDLNPSLEGHEDLVRAWQIDREADRQYTAFMEGEGKDLNDFDRGQAYIGIFHRYSESEELQEQIKHYMENPETLHALVIEEIRQEVDVDENGFATHIDGTSFSAPVLGGYNSGAMYEQEQREENDLPMLTKEEITTLAKMATIDTQRREGQDMPSVLKTNLAGFDFVHGAGHGVFQPDMFRTLLNEAYNKMENDPDINRDQVTTVMSGVIDSETGSSKTAMHTNLPEDSEVVIDRLRVDMEYSVNGLNPQLVVIQKPGEDAALIAPIENASSSASEFLGWARVESNFGESLNADQIWNVQLFDDKNTTLDTMSVTVYGYDKGGLMDQMISYGRQLIEEQKPVAPTETIPAVEERNEDVKPVVPR